MELVEQGGQLPVFQRRNVRDSLFIGRNVIAGAVHRIAFYREGDDLAKQSRIQGCDRAQRFKVTGARRLEVDELSGQAGRNRVYAELVGSGVEAELVRAVGAGHGDMLRK